MLQVVRVSRTEFELENGQVFPIDPPLPEEMSPDEFQQHYELAIKAIQSCRAPGSNNSNPSDLG